MVRDQMTLELQYRAANMYWAWDQESTKYVLHLMTRNILIQ